MTGLPSRLFWCTTMLAVRAHAQSIPGAVLAKHEPHHHLAYEDSILRILRVRVPAHDTTLLHEHDPDYFWIALGASTVVNARLGAADATITSPDLSIHYTLGNFAHVARNPGEGSFDNITVELLRPQSGVRNLCEMAVAGKAIDCAPGTGTGVAGVSEYPAFTTDQLQVNRVTIAPGATLRPTTSTKHVWVIALDTLDTVRGLAIESGGRWVGGTFRSAGDSDWRIRNRSVKAIGVLTVTPR
jgi:hypothetical protein